MCGLPKSAESRKQLSGSDSPSGSEELLAHFNTDAGIRRANHCVAKRNFGLERVLRTVAHIAGDHVSPARSLHE